MIEAVITVIASISVVLGAITAVLSIFNKAKTAEIHLLVNNRLDTAISEIEDLKHQRDLKQQKDD